MKRYTVGKFAILWSWNKYDRTFWQNFKYNFLPFFCSMGKLITWECDDDRQVTKKKLEILEKISLDGLNQHCPLCGRVGKNLYCKECDFKWEKDMIYINKSSKLSKLLKNKTN